MTLLQIRGSIAQWCGHLLSYIGSLCISLGVTPPSLVHSADCSSKCATDSKESAQHRDHRCLWPANFAFVFYLYQDYHEFILYHLAHFTKFRERSLCRSTVLFTRQLQIYSSNPLEYFIKLQGADSLWLAGDWSSARFWSKGLSGFHRLSHLPKAPWDR